MFFFQYTFLIGFFGIKEIENFLTVTALLSVENCISLIMTSGRHSSFQCCRLYIQDIAHRLGQTECLGILGNDVGKWKPINLIFDTACNQVGYDSVKHFYGNIVFVATNYFTRDLNIPDPSFFSYEELLKAAEDYWMVLHQPTTYFDRTMLRHNNSNICPLCRNEPINSHHPPSPTAPEIIVTTNPSESSSSTNSDSTEFNRFFGNYKLFKKKNRVDMRKRILIIRNLYPKVTVNKRLKLSARSMDFYYRHGFHKIGRCIEKCYNGDVESYLNSIPPGRGLYGYKCNVTPSRCAVTTVDV